MNRREAGKLGIAKARRTLDANWAKFKAAYEDNPSHCKLESCRQPLPYEKRRNDFCNHSCAATVTNGCKPRKVRICPCGNPSGLNRQCPGCIAAGLVHTKVAFADLHTDQARRRRLLKIRDLCCAICMVREWQGNPVPLVVDHADGNPENNDPTNLRLICRNCDGQLPTFAGKNRGRGRKARRDRYAKEKFAALAQK